MKVNLLLVLACCCVLEAQTPEADGKPATSNVSGAQYPRVHSDGRVTFRVSAPDAQKVQLQPGGADNGLGRGPFDMVRDDKGNWTYTTSPAIPGFHYYWLLIDGFAANDPSSRTYYGWGKDSSAVEVPDKDGNFYAAKDVPHGDVRIHPYHSKTTGSWRVAFVYTPPGYYKGTARYPVLYLPAWSRRRRDRLDETGPRKSDLGQPLGLRQSRSDAGRHGYRICL